MINTNENISKPSTFDNIHKKNHIHSIILIKNAIKKSNFTKGILIILRRKNFSPIFGDITYFLP